MKPQDINFVLSVGKFISVPVHLFIVQREFYWTAIFHPSETMMIHFCETFWWALRFKMILLNFMQLSMPQTVSLQPAQLNYPFSPTPFIKCPSFSSYFIITFFYSYYERAPKSNLWKLVENHQEPWHDFFFSCAWYVDRMRTHVIFTFLKFSIALVILILWSSIASYSKTD